MAEQIRLTNVVEITSDALEQPGSERYPQLLAKSRALAVRLYSVTREPRAPFEENGAKDSGGNELPRMIISYTNHRAKAPCAYLSVSLNRPRE